MMSPRIDRSFSMTRVDSTDDGTPGSPNILRKQADFCVASTIISLALYVCLRELRAELRFENWAH